MNFRQFAVNNVVRNKRTYIAHFLSSAFSVMIFFTYALLLFHPDLQGELASSSGTMSRLGTMGMKVSQYIVFIFSFFFLLYSVGAFLKLRKKEFGILFILGMSRKQLNRLLFIENLLIGVASIAAGISVGLIFSKLILIISARLLAIDHGLPFYVPLEAVGMTSIAFLGLFLLIALSTSAMVRKGTLIALVKSEENPKPEPKASKWLSILAILLIGMGYAMVFYFVIWHVFSLLLLSMGVGLVILGSYFLFTQLSVYAMRALKKKKTFFFKKTNVLTISELTYRVKDNAVMFFLVSIISAVAFTGIGTCVAIGNPGLTAMTSPYAFTYSSSVGNKLEEQHIRAIEQELTKRHYSYQVGSVVPMYSENGIKVIKLPDYNDLVQALGYEREVLDNEQEILLVPTSVSQRNSFKLHGAPMNHIDIRQGAANTTFQIKKIVPHIVLPGGSSTMAVLSESMYNRIFGKQLEDARTLKYVQFVMKDWQHSKDVSQMLMSTINDSNQGDYHLKALVMDWIASRQLNGILFIVSGLVGIVFFTFAVSFIYFRLYADSERDEQQYRMISKVGLSRRELNKIVSQQLLLMFFLPIALAIIHSSVAFIALQQLVDFSVLKQTVFVFIAFLSIQVVYYFITRRRYLGHLYQKLV
jgi:putative ABC transport system permease protein